MLPRSMRCRRALLFAVGYLLWSSAGLARADIFGVAGGAGDPGPTLGGYTMTPFAIDNQAAGNLVTSLASPLGGSLTFSYALVSNTQVGIGGQWSGSPPNSFTGDVYSNQGKGNLTLTLPSNTVAFYLYVEPNSYGRLEAISVTAQNGTSVTQSVESATTGAQYYGFYATGSDTITSLTVSEPTLGDYIVGEFAIATAGPTAAPEPATLTLLGMAAVSLSAFGLLRRRKQSVAA